MHAQDITIHNISAVSNHTASSYSIILVHFQTTECISNAMIPPFSVFCHNIPSLKKKYSTVLSGDCDERMSYLSSSEAYDL